MSGKKCLVIAIEKNIARQTILPYHRGLMPSTTGWGLGAGEG